MTLQVDASDRAIGGVLLQEGKPVCFTSHTFNSTGRNYAQIEKECLAIVSCMDKWHYYLYGKYDTTVHSDHQPLEIIFKEASEQRPSQTAKNDAKVANISVHRPIQERERTFCSR